MTVAKSPSLSKLKRPSEQRELQPRVANITHNVQHLNQIEVISVVFVYTITIDTMIV